MATILCLAAVAGAASRSVHWVESAPPARSGATAVYDSVSDRVVVLGGTLGYDGRNALPSWECTEGGGGEWRRIPLPSLLESSPALSTFDPVRRQLWQFENYAGAPAVRLNLAPGGGSTEIPVVADPDFRRDGIAFDSESQRFYALSRRYALGVDTLALECAPLGDTLRFHRIAIAGTPSVSTPLQLLGWDPEHAAFVLVARDPLGGLTELLRVSTATPRSETFYASPDPAGGSPTVLQGVDAYDPESGALYLLEPFRGDNGIRGAGTPWRLDPGSSPHWTRLPSPPRASFGAAMAFDSQRRRLVLVGGSDSGYNPRE